MLQDDYSNCLISQNLFAAGCDDYSEVHVWNLNSDIKVNEKLLLPFVESNLGPLS